MMRIITPNGKLKQVENVVPMCEMRFQFNGEKKRMIEIARGMDTEPTALQLQARSSRLDAFGHSCDHLLVGNLKPEKVKEIQRKLLTQGYFDFSELDYQKAGWTGDTVFDNGETKPYALECFTEDQILNAFSTAPHFGMGVPVPNQGVCGETSVADDDIANDGDDDGWGGEEIHEQK